MVLGSSLEAAISPAQGPSQQHTRESKNILVSQWVEKGGLLSRTSKRTFLVVFSPYLLSGCLAPEP